jgi:disulfide oxidoreductase YuzD
LGNNPVKVTIINDPLRKQDCDASCGTDWSSLQSLDLARKQINERFNGNIQLTYMDMDNETTSDEMKRWISSVKSGNLSVPLLVINGQLRISGSFDIRQMIDAIEVETEMGV